MNQKRFFSKGLFIFFMVSAVFFSSCSKKESKDLSSGKTKISATFFPLYVMLLNITEGADVELSMLAPANTGCLHDYQLTTKDMKVIEECDILVVNGAGMEDFLDKALSIKKDSTVIASEGYDLLTEEGSLQPNAHVWVSLEGAVYEVNKITQGLCALDAKSAELYKKNAESYVKKIKSLQTRMQSELTLLKGRSVITFHEAFPYFAKEFSLNTIAVVEREPGTEPTARELKEIVSLIKSAALQNKGQIPLLFAEPQYSSSAAQIIAAETGLKVQELDPAVTIAEDAASDEALKNSYLKTMEKNLAVLKSVL